MRHVSRPGLGALRAHHPQPDRGLREVRTEGDRRPDASLLLIGGQGVFVKELEAALLRGEIDLAVHSLKDVPAELGEGLTIAAMPERADPRDALVSRAGGTLAEASEDPRARPLGAMIKEFEEEDGGQV